MPKACDGCIYWEKHKDKCDYYWELKKDCSMHSDRQNF